MATKCSVWLRQENGSYLGIYIHWDGYLKGVGSTLLRYYDTREKITSLMDLGFLSDLAPSLDCPAGHTFSKPIQGYCVAYHRDRGEEFNNYSQPDELSFNTAIESLPLDYHYVWIDNRWYFCQKKHSEKLSWEPIPFGVACP